MATVNKNVKENAEEVKNFAKENNATLFTGEQLRKSRKFAKYKDIIAVVIGTDESCTIEECEKRINEFLSKEVG